MMPSITPLSSSSSLFFLPSLLPPLSSSSPLFFLNPVPSPSLACAPFSYLTHFLTPSRTPYPRLLSLFSFFLSAGKAHYQKQWAESKEMSAEQHTAMWYICVTDTVTQTPQCLSLSLRLSLEQASDISLHWITCGMCTGLHVECAYILIPLHTHKFTDQITRTYQYIKGKAGHQWSGLRCQRRARKRDGFRRA